ncbi:MAG: bifunctional adenosylcobinamide kinase/adenosylcobinamide-phosphate guanylyltransferase [Hominisplanchenecus sp.]|nr:bifunctional adenosylcobinamide kinase/adenosylcobinamide-phosphate guanylyltransferase [Lachnospiraceae bacterium]
MKIRTGGIMKLVIGGAYQGKYAYASEKYCINNWADGRSCDFEEIFQCEGIHHFHEYIRRALTDEREIRALRCRLKEENREIVIITNELGYGVVPMDAFDRRFREIHGRLCCELAAEAEEVCRVICGIGMVIKHA